MRERGREGEMESEGKERWSWGGIVRGRERGEGERGER